MFQLFAKIDFKNFLQELNKFSVYRVAMEGWGDLKERWNIYVLENRIFVMWDVVFNGVPVFNFT